MREIVSLFVGGFLLCTCIGQTCPPCPSNNDCDSFIPVRSKANRKCICSLCIRYCWDRYPRCLPGTVCVMEPIECPFGYNCGLVPPNSAVCISFNTCSPIDPACACPVSDFLLDQNNCKSCLCNDPCLELNCTAEQTCNSWSIQPGTELNYECA